MKVHLAIYDVDGNELFYASGPRTPPIPSVGEIVKLRDRPHDPLNEPPPPYTSYRVEDREYYVARLSFKIDPFDEYGVTLTVRKIE